MPVTPERIEARLKTPQLKELADLAELLASGLVDNWRTAIDGGAHVGGWSRALAPRFALVHAYEPAPDTFGLLAANVADLVNVIPHQQALLDEPIGVDVINPRGEGRGPLTARYMKKAPGAGTAQSTTVDALGLTDLDFIKLDLEGAEVLALQGARETLLRCSPLIVIEEFGHAHRYGFADDAAAEQLLLWGYVQVWEAGPNFAFKKDAK